MLVEVEGRKHPLVNVEASQRLIKQTTDLGRASNGQNAKSATGSTGSSVAVIKALSDEALAGEMKLAMLHKAQYDAKQTELDYRRDAGDLIDAEMVRLAVTGISTGLRQNLERLPDRLADKLCLMTDRLEVQKYISTELDLAMADMAEAIKNNAVIYENG